MMSKAKKEKDWGIGRTGSSSEVKAQGCSGLLAEPVCSLLAGKSALEAKL